MRSNDGLENGDDLLPIGEVAEMTGRHPAALLSALVTLGHDADLRHIGPTTLVPRWCAESAARYLPGESPGRTP